MAETSGREATWRPLELPLWAQCVAVLVACAALYAASLPWPLARGALVLVLVAVLVAQLVRGIHATRVTVPASVIGGVVLAWLAATSVAAFSAQDEHLGIHRAIWHGLSAVVFFAVAGRPGEEERRRVVTILVLSACVACVLALTLEWTGLTPSQICFTLKDQNVFAAFLLLVAPLAAWRAVAARHGSRKAAFVVCAIIVVGTLLATGSRGAAVGLALACAMLWALSGTAPRHGKAARLAAVLAIAVFMLTPALISQALSFPTATSSMPHRLFMWITVGRMARHFPLTGVGPGNFQLGFISHRPLGERNSFAISIPADAHNDLMDALAEGGFIGLLLTGSLILLALTGSARAALSENVKARFGINAALFAAFAGWSANGLLNSSLNNPAIEPTWFALLGLVAASGGRPLGSDPATAQMRFAGAPKWLSLGLFLALLSYVAQRTVRTAIAFTLVVAPANPTDLAPLLQAARIDATYNVPYQVLGAKAADVRPELAIEALERSCELVPSYAESHRALALLLLERGQRDRGLNELRKAVQLDPYNGYYCLDLARAMRDQRSDRSLALVNHAAFLLSMTAEVVSSRYGSGSVEMRSVEQAMDEARDVRRSIMGLR